MPGRIIPLISGEIYHVVNRGIAGQPIFLNKRDYQRFLELMLYYQNINAPIRYSKFLTLSLVDRNNILASLRKQRNYAVEFISYCLMPNHFHLLLRQTKDDGIAKYLSNLSNSYTRYFNVKNKRYGPIYQGKFKAVRVQDDEQLLHVVRYIHLNPYSSYIVKKIEDITEYPYSSFGEYLKLRTIQIVDKEVVLSQYKTVKSFKEFTIDQADYQRKLTYIKHLTLEN